MTGRSQTRMLLAALGLAFMCTAGHAGAAPGAPAVLPLVEAAVSSSADTLSNGNFERRILRRVNNRRSGADLPRIRPDACLDGYAENWALHLSKTQVLKHSDQQVVVTKCDLTWAGEVLAWGTSLTPGKTVAAWLDSPSHRAVLMKRRAAWVGIGVHTNAEDQTFAVLNAGDRE